MYYVRTSDPGPRRSEGFRRVYSQPAGMNSRYLPTSGIRESAKEVPARALRHELRVNECP